ncbi:P-type ATPase [Aspergillus melleus]|uniref:P-type ATPase n=1 Tax=Aspergillus melleus TaxID=138277 RepID=UPI001E8D864F|nr:P-type ATPase [Aspergillus melleus]KAH8430699.1 P-type ATPase [Aspergillus melleus]
MGKDKAPASTSGVTGYGNKPLSRPAHALAWETVADELDTSAQGGLTASDAQSRLDQYGRNDIGNASSTSAVRVLLKQVANAMTFILILATAVSLGIEAWIEGGVLAAVVLINIVVGFIQEFQAGKTMDSLRTLSSPTATVVRDQQVLSTQTAEIVPGDLVEMKTGDTIPADVRLIEALNFETDEALLTGESLPVRKLVSDTFEDDTGPGDRLNIAYSSSTVTKGRAKGVVFGTGMHTEIGSIAAALREKGSGGLKVQRRSDGSASAWSYTVAVFMVIVSFIGGFLGTNVGTPLQRKLSRLAIFLFFTAVLCAIIVLAANRFNSQKEVIIYAVATGLSMIPSSLVVVLTITMTVGTKRMVERQVIVRNLNSLEALGAVTDICSDKTGTLTQGKMVAKKIWIPARGTYSVGESSEPYNPTIGGLSNDPKEPRHIDFTNSVEEEKLDRAERFLEGNPELEEYLKTASLANLAVVFKEDSGEWKARGDPTEIAIQVLASRFGWNRLNFTEGEIPSWKQVAEFPFDSDVKRMSVIFEEALTGKSYVFTKGAVERVIASCTSVHTQSGGQAEQMTEEIKENILANMEAIAALGLRVLALASREYHESIDDSEDIKRDTVESDLVFRGLIGLYDPPRPESAPSVRRCHEAGISVHMLTGDHPGTARAIALDVGILPSRINELSKDVLDAMVMTAHQFDKLSDDEVDALPTLPLVIARCAPSTKVRMIKALHRRKKFAGMTGDGVNDSPSLKDADVGIAMGQAGSDVAKDASDIVLTDDNFASILNAIEEGRRMFDNIQKFILHVLSQNFAQALVLLVGLAFKDEQDLSVFPLSPVEIVWLVMITSGLPDMGLGFEQATADIMSRPPRSIKKGIFTLEVMIDMIVYGIWVAALCLGAFTLVMYGFGKGKFGNDCNNELEGCEIAFRARATTFACLTWFVLFLAWEMIDMRRSFFNMRPSSSHSWTQFARDIWQNPFLFWANISGFVMVFPLLYIPVINTKVFRHTGISWEWAIVIVGTVLFFLGAESWKWVKRAYFRRVAAKVEGQGVGLEV